MRQVLRAGALGRPRGMGWGRRWEGGSGWGTHVNPWLIHVNVWQKPLQYCKVISLQLIKINLKKREEMQGKLLWAVYFFCPSLLRRTQDHSFSVPLAAHFHLMGFPAVSEGKESTCGAGDLSSIPGSGDPPEKVMATHSVILAWRIPWREDPGGLQSVGSQRLRCD